ncbi:MAG: hypothetical protein V4663_04215 [Bacteroidota bacterium]
MKKKSTYSTLLLKFSLLLVFLSSYHLAFSQLIPISLEQRIDNSSQIFEGEVISKRSYWDENKTHIYTVNVVNIYKVFKGVSTQKQIEIVTMGGIVGDMMEEVSHSLQLNVGDAGVFTAIANTAKLNARSSLTRLKAYAGAQGFIKYDLKTGTAKDSFNTYSSVSKDVYPKITTRTKSSIKTVQKSTLKIN